MVDDYGGAMYADISCILTVIIPGFRHRAIYTFGHGHLNPNKATKKGAYSGLPSHLCLHVSKHGGSHPYKNQIPGLFMHRYPCTLTFQCFLATYARYTGMEAEFREGGVRVTINY